MSTFHWQRSHPLRWLLYLKKKKTLQKTISIDDNAENLEPCALLEGMQTGITLVENTMVIPQKIKDRITI